MELRIDLSALWREVRRLSDEPADFDWTPGIALDPIDIELRKGKEIQLSDLQVVNGLLSVEGRQVLLFIPDQYKAIEVVQSDPEEGRRFHVSDCKTLRKMKASGRLERYIVTNRLDGVFEITGNNHRGESASCEARLMVCKNCLEAVNFGNYLHQAYGAKQGIWYGFEIAEFFNEFSTSFRHLPKGIAARLGSGDYTDDWGAISSRVRQGCGFRCDDCRIDLSAHPGLLHVHHINGVKSDNSAANLRPLCADCHRKQPLHERMFIRRADMALISRIRHEQGVDVSDWEKVLRLADLSIRGALAHANASGFDPPVVGHLHHLHEGGSLAFEAAWPARRIALSLDEDTSVPGWKVHDVASFVASY